MYILDTNVISELRKVASGKANKHVEQWSYSVDSELLYVSSITVHEIELGILLAEKLDKAKGYVLRKWMSEHVLPAFKERILSVDKDVAIVSASYHAQNPKPYRDTLIAATAVVNNMAVITRNTEDFCLEGVRLINPWNYKEY